MSSEVEECNDDSPRNEPAIFSCPEQGCSKEYRNLHSLETHICIGNHVYTNKENSIDKVKHLWAEKCMSVDKNFKVLIRSTSERAVDTQEGWALKTNRTQKRFSAKVKDFLYSIYLDCERTGKRPNFDNIAADLKALRNDDGSKHFNRVLHKSEACLQIL
jgi:hypothetical protein